MGSSLFSFTQNNHVALPFSKVVLQIKRLKALWKGKKTQSAAQWKPWYCQKRCESVHSCVVYIIDETLCSAIRKIMSSHVNDRSVCALQNECPVICKALPQRVKTCLYIWKSSENRDASLCSIEQTALFIPFSLIFILFTPLWVSGSFPISPLLPGPIPDSLETGGRVVISDSGRWLWLIDSTSDGTCVTSSFPMLLWPCHLLRWTGTINVLCIYFCAIWLFDMRNVFMPALPVFLCKPQVVLSLVI